MSAEDRGPYFDQDKPDYPVEFMVADLDISEPYELTAAAVFRIAGRPGYLVVYVSGCSCWPSRGETRQVYCQNKAAVDRELTGEWRPLLDACQAAKWVQATPTKAQS